MNWIRVCVNIADDPAIGRIADACDIPLAEAIGAVVAVLCKLPAHARDGVLTEVSDRTLEQWANWEHQRGRFAQAFRDALCDDAGVVRSWERHNGAAIREATAARDRMREARKKPREERPETPKKPKSERSGERAANVPQTFASNGTGRNEYPPTSPIGSVVLPAPPEPNTGRTVPISMAQAPVTTNAGPLFAEWEQTLFAAALPHEAAALELICSRGFRPAIIGELYAIASGQHLVRGEHSAREATASDVMRAVSEYACKGRPEWNQSYFRGVVRRILDRPPEPPDAAQREQERLAREVARAVPSLVSEQVRTPEELEAARVRREEAMAKFRAEYQRNNAAGSKSITPIAGVLGSVVKELVA